MTELIAFDKAVSSKLGSESAIQAFADAFLKEAGFEVKHHKTGNASIDKAWPSKAKTAKSKGAPDLLVYGSAEDKLPFCVWENKDAAVSVATALKEAQFYIEGLHQKKPGHPNLPRLAAGFNGSSLRLSYLNFESTWVDVKVDGAVVVDRFPKPAFAAIGIASNGNFNAVSGTVKASDIRKALPALKTLYRSIPVLASGRRPIDFTVALLTLKMLLESQRDWGTWAEQPGLVPDASSLDHAVGERFKLLANRILGEPKLKAKYGDIFLFREQAKDNQEVAFNFVETLAAIEIGQQFFRRMFVIVDALPPLHGADFDIFGEVYQAIGDDATKKALGEFFTGRHIISALVPVLFERAGVHSFESQLKGRTIADVACGTGGFLTETLRFVRSKFGLSEQTTKSFAASAFYGYDLSHANASRARVNMYFAGDGFSVIDGGVNSLADPASGKAKTYDFILTNPPYGSSSQYQRLEEAFLRKVVASLKPGAGWGLIVVPTGTLENPRSGEARRLLLQEVVLTDAISLPSHAFAPYTQQRTSVLIFRRRETPIAATDWPALLKEIEDEEISLFVVDNDGFANSDKRYETSRRDSNGQWLHDDLRPWIDQSGKLVPGKLFNALIKKVQPPAATNEFAEPTGPKYGRFKVKELLAFEASRGADKAGGIELLPDTYLRPKFGTVLLADWEKAALAVLKDSGPNAATSSTDASVRERVKTILASPVGFGEAAKTALLNDRFDVVKGDQGLTEAVIYGQYDPQGLPVYGGGEAPPRFFIAPNSVNKAGAAVRTHTGPALIISMDGSSGFVRVIAGKTKFVVNHHGCVLKPKTGVKLDLNFVAQQIEGGLRSLASNKEGSATLTLPALNSFKFSLAPSDSDMKRIGKLRRSLSVLRDKFR